MNKLSNIRGFYAWRYSKYPGELRTFYTTDSCSNGSRVFSILRSTCLACTYNNTNRL